MPCSSSETYVKSRLFKIDLISTIIVRSLSNDRDARPIDFFKQRFTLLIRRSQNPPCPGDFSILNSHVTPLLARYR